MTPYEWLKEQYDALPAMAAKWRESDEGLAVAAIVALEWTCDKAAIKQKMREMYYDTLSVLRKKLDDELKTIFATRDSYSVNAYMHFFRETMILIETLNFYITEYEARFDGNWQTWIMIADD